MAASVGLAFSALIALALVTGQVGRPGTGLHPLRGQNNVQGASDAGLIPMVYPNYHPVSDPAMKKRYEELWGVDNLDPNTGLTVVEIMRAVHAGEILGMYIMGENPAMSDPNLNHARSALAALDHLVLQDMFLTETAAYADVVLPASGWAEKDGTVYVMGVIDFLTHYGSRKRAERGLKSFALCQSRQGMSVAPASLYARRFMNFMDTVVLE